MQKFDKLVPLQDLLRDDLETLCSDLQAEFSQMGGGRLLITGGGGFLGYYLIQSVLHWNDTRGAGARIKTVVYDNYARGVPEWLSFDGEASVKVNAIPTREQINLPVQEQLIVELYSK